MSVFHPSVSQHQTGMAAFTDMCSARVYLHPALHSNVVGLRGYQRVQLRLVGSLSLIRRSDCQHDQIVIADHQL